MLTCVKHLITPYRTAYICFVNALKFKRIIYLIAVTAMITIGAQVYRNVQNYELNKQRFISDVQQTLDLSLEAYYADLVKEDIVIFESSRQGDTNGSQQMPVLKGVWSISDSASDINMSLNEYLKKRPKIRDSVFGTSSSQIDTVLTGIEPSMISRITLNNSLTGISADTVVSRNIKIDFTDSLHRIKGFAQKLAISLVQNSLDFDELSGYVNDEMARKGIKVNYVLVQYSSRPNLSFSKLGSNTPVFLEKSFNDTIFSNHQDTPDDFPLETFSKSTYLSNNQKLAIRFENASLDILKRGGVDLLISLLITCAVIGSLLYLYRVISEQKALAEIKNDLISNITHEFKTPIATISTALEGIMNFNQANDPAKTTKYLDISKGQLKKLNGMVEKLLETASLDSDELEIAKEEVEVVVFTRQLFERFHLIKGEKKLAFETDLTEQWLKVDPFHMENAIANLLDNAIKYGGDEILLKLSKINSTVVWSVADNGGNINKQEQLRIFDKFYRIPTGNVHNVKGFGIGLYYTKTLVEKHGGKIDLKVSPNSTIFSISIDGKA